MNWRFWRKEPEAKEESLHQGIGLPFPYGMQEDLPPQFAADYIRAQMAERMKPPTQFIFPDWLDRMMARVMERFPMEERPEGWKMHAYQTKDLYILVLTGPVITVSHDGEPVSMTHELEFGKSVIRDSSEEVAEWTIYKALETVFGLIGQHGPFPPELQDMR